MALDKVIQTFKGMVKDIAKESYSPEFYYDAHNIKIISTDTQSTGAVSNEKGTSYEFMIPYISNIQTSGGNTVVVFTTTPGVSTNSPLVYDGIHSEVSNLTVSGDQKIIGYSSIEECIVFITTNSNGLDCIWKVYKDPDWKIDLVYINDLGLNIDNPLDVKIRFDSKKLIKVYFSDFNNQLRHINISDPDVINLKKSFLDIVSEVTMSQPKLVEKSYGGLNTSGMVQYAYNLYKQHGQQTKISAISELIPISLPNRGGDVNEVVGQTNKILIDNIDTEYDSIIVYAIKYNSYAELPIVSIIADQKIDGTSSYFYDDGKVLSSYSLGEFMLLGGDPIIVKNIESKDNRLFLANYKTKDFDIEFDARAYSYDSSNVCKLKDSNGTITTYSDPINQVSITDDAINVDFDIYKYRDGAASSPISGKYVKATGLGGSGKYINYYVYQLDSSELSTTNADINNRFLKSREVYRLAIEFYNKLGQYSYPKWIGDFKVPNGNITGNYNILEVELTPAAITYLQSQGVIGWRVLRAKRDVTDMTVLSQGVVNPVITQTTDSSVIAPADQTGMGSAFEDLYIKLPSFFTRTFNKYVESIPGYGNLYIAPIEHNAAAFTYRTASLVDNPHTELYTESIYPNAPGDWRDYRKHLTYVYSKLFTFTSPEILFRENFNLETSVFVNPIGVYVDQSNKSWGRRYDVNNHQITAEYKNLSGLSLFSISGRKLHSFGLIGQSGDNNQEEFYQYYRKFSNFVLSYNWDDNIELLDLPENVDYNQEIIYGNNSKLRFWNSLYSIIGDGRKKDDITKMIAVNSEGVKSLVFAERNLNSLESLYKNTSSSNFTTGLPIMELSKEVPNQYGGSSYENRKRTEYLRIGDYNDLATSSTLIESPGDIYVHNFVVDKILPIGEEEVFGEKLTQYTEIIEFPVETTIDLKNRHDASNNSWDSKFQPSAEDAFKYNNVYTQEADWNVTTDLEYNFDEVKHFPNAIIPTKTKLDNEVIDSWTNLLFNAELKLEGEYGDITELVAFTDSLISFQPRGIALVSVNPRIQVVATDNSALELGKGGILHDYKYLSTTSGSLNKYSILGTQSGLFYYDALNNSFNILTGGKTEAISKKMGLDLYFKNNIDFKSVVTDNPFKKEGVLVVEDSIGDGVLFISNSDAGSFNLFWGITSNTFQTFLDYNPTIGINYKNEFLTNSGINIYSHYNGDYNRYYGNKFPSSITLLVNIKSTDHIYNTIEYRSEAFKDLVDMPKITFNGMRIYNDYQDTGFKPLTLNSNIFKKFRTWRITIPRDKDNKLDRIRGSWAYMYLEFDHEDNFKFVFHNPIIYFDNAEITI